MKFRSVVLSVPLKLLISILLFWSFSRIIIAAGDGAAPVSDFLIYGEAPEWLLPQIAGWSAVVIEVVSYVFMPRKSWAALTAISTASLTSALVLLLVRSETLRIPEWRFEIDRFALFAALIGTRIFQVILALRPKGPGRTTE